MPGEGEGESEFEIIIFQRESVKRVDDAQKEGISHDIPCDVLRYPHHPHPLSLFYSNIISSSRYIDGVFMTTN